MLAATGIVTEEATPLIGGLRARAGHLHLALVVLWVAGGTWSADVLLYFIGRWHGDWVRRRWPKIRTLVLRIFRMVRRHPWRSSASVRFAYGLRLTLPIACGAARVPLWLYLIGSAISAFLWSAVFTLLGWGLGETALRLLGHLRQYEEAIGIGIVIAIVVLYFALRRRHVEEEVVEVIDRDTSIPFLPHAHVHRGHAGELRTPSASVPAADPHPSAGNEGEHPVGGDATAASPGDADEGGTGPNP